MATYKKPSVSVSGKTLMGYEFEGGIYEDLKKHKSITIEGEENKVLIPFHAVKEYQKCVTSADAERPDPYCGGVLIPAP